MRGHVDGVGRRDANAFAGQRRQARGLDRDPAAAGGLVRQRELADVGRAGVEDDRVAELRWFSRVWNSLEVDANRSASNVRDSSDSRCFITVPHLLRWRILNTISPDKRSPCLATRPKCGQTARVCGYGFTR